MKIFFFLILSGASLLSGDIMSIHTPADAQTAQVFCVSSGAKYHEAIRPANLSPEGQDAWSAALGYAGSAVLGDGEAIRSVIFEPVPDEVVVTRDEETGAPTAWRDLIRISISIDTVVQGGPAVRYETLTSEDLPPQIRDGLLALYASLRLLDRAGLAALGAE